MKAVTKVKSGCDECVYELLCRLLRQKVSDFGNASKVHVRYLADTTDVLLKGHTLVEYDT